MAPANVLRFAAEQYGFDADTLRLISATTNEVYHFRKGEQAYILRVAQRPPVWVARIAAELDWLDYLARQGVSVSLPLRSRSGAFVVGTEEEGQHYILSAFTMATGRFWDKNDPARWNPAVWRRWGQLLGDLHRLTKAYAPSSGQPLRDTFAERESIPANLKACPTVYAIAQVLLDEIRGLPTDSDGYGLIHYDLHPWNFLLDGDRINVFDFDDCLYGWFALDIGVALYHGLWWGRHDDATPMPHAYGDDLIRHVISGYLSRNPLSAFWLAKIPLFMRYRQVCKFSWFYDPDRPDAEQRTRITNIEKGVLFSDFMLDERLFCLQTYA